MDHKTDLIAIEAKAKRIRDGIAAMPTTTSAETILKQVALMAFEIIDELIEYVKKTATTVH